MASQMCHLNLPGDRKSIPSFRGRVKNAGIEAPHHQTGIPSITCFDRRQCR
jgi:hypothetical protein